MLAELRARGLRLVICSNWDWDLAEAVDEAGLTAAVDAIVSSAWVGARKPHPRIYAADARRGRRRRRPRRCSSATPGAPTSRARSPPGSPPVYLRRDGHWPDGTCPHDEPRRRPSVPVIADLRGLLDLVESAAVP